MSCLAVVTTIDSRERAQALAQALVERGLAACVQISAIDSVYLWDGAVQQAAEYRVLAKTVAARYAEVEAAIVSLHSYQLPAIHAFALAEVYPPYADWISAATAAR